MQVYGPRHHPSHAALSVLSSGQSCGRASQSLPAYRCSPASPSQRLARTDCNTAPLSPYGVQLLNFQFPSAGGQTGRFSQGHFVCVAIPCNTGAHNTKPRRPKSPSAAIRSSRSYQTPLVTPTHPPIRTVLWQYIGIRPLCQSCD